MKICRWSFITVGLIICPSPKVRFSIRVFQSISLRNDLSFFNQFVDLFHARGQLSVSATLLSSFLALLSRTSLTQIRTLSILREPIVFHHLWQHRQKCYTFHYFHSGVDTSLKYTGWSNAVNFSIVQCSYLLKGLMWIPRFLWDYSYISTCVHQTFNFNTI